MAVRVRMAPSPTGFLHVGGVRARSCSTGSSRASTTASACCGSRTRTRAARSQSATEQIQRSLTLARPRLGRHVDASSSTGSSAASRRRGGWSPSGKAYEDEGAIRFRMPDEGVTGVGRSRARPDRVPERGARRPRDRPLGRSPDLQLRVADRGLARRDHARRSAADDHVSNTPKQINMLARARRRARPCTHTARRARRGRQEALEAARRAVARRVPRRGLHRAGADELPRAARLELRRQDDDDVARRADRAVLARARAARARRRSTTRSSTG